MDPNGATGRDDQAGPANNNAQALLFERLATAMNKIGKRDPNVQSSLKFISMMVSVWLVQETQSYSLSATWKVFQPTIGIRRLPSYI